MAKSGRKIKLSQNLRPFVSRVSRDGYAQKAFTNVIGKTTGQCVKTGIKGKNLTKKQMKKVFKDCADALGDKTGQVKAEIAKLRAANK